jgi:DnaJ-class molecular chaperone
MMRIKWEGDAGQRGGPSGDLYILLSPNPNALILDSNALTIRT